MEATAMKCPWCGEEFDEEESENPQRDESGEAICDECWDEAYMDYCSHCENLVEKRQLAAVGSLIGVWRSADGLSSRIRRGYYRVLRWPFYMDGMIEGYFLNDSLQRVAPLDARGRALGRESHAASGPLCSDCCREIVDPLDRLREAQGAA